MNDPLNKLDPIEVGNRLRCTREATRFSQAEAADAIGVARTTLVAIEKGSRRVRMPELQGLVNLYGTTINALLRRGAIHVDLIPQFRRHTRAGDDAAIAAAQLLSDLAKAEVELENLLGIAHVQNYPQQRRILGGDVKIQAEQDAADVRGALGLGIRPLGDVITLLELDLGVRVYVRPLDSSISGLFAYEASLGACILLNANQPFTRRNQTAVHEFAHLITSRNIPEVLHDVSAQSSREERYASAFAQAFLVPPRAAMQKFEEIVAGADRLTRRHVILLAHYFCVSREALVRRLEELGLVKVGTWDWFLNQGGITNEQERQVLGDLRQDGRALEAGSPTSIRIGLLAAEAHRRGLLSEGQLARLLKLERPEVRAILDEGLEDDIA